MGGQSDNEGRFARPRLLAAAERRHWVVTYQELRAGGFTERQVRYATATGFLHRRHREVYAVGRPELSFEGECLAAVLACGAGSHVSHGPAGRVWGFRRWEGTIHVTGPRSLAGRPGLVVHRPRRLFAADTTIRRGIPVTTVPRTLLDLATTLTVDQLGGCMNEAAVQRVLVLRDVWAVLQRHPRHPGAKRLEAALALEVIPARSDLELAFHRLVARAKLPRPLVNSLQWGGERKEEVDFCWPAPRLIVETDGGPYHASRWRRRRDAAKDARFRALGWTVWRVPDLQIELDPAGVSARLTDLVGHTDLR